YAVTDGVVVWRAWILCKNESKKLLFLCIFVLICAICSSVAAIVIEALVKFTSAEDEERTNILTRAIDVCHVMTLALSLLTNLLATSIISWKAWRFRKMFHLSWANGGRILTLLIESGVLYSALLTITLISTIIHLPVGSLGDLITPVTLQLSGMYPLIVLIMVSYNQSLDNISFSRGTLMGRTYSTSVFTSIFEVESDCST
ncbi:hypothetical protein GYMLUDRAFT_174880, partial [Collybiopsis luxurians FD-317 M1]